jgi:hypothetical protein
MEKGICSKCKREEYLEEHHILPQSIFKGIGPTILLCPNCHTKYHQALGTEGLKNTDMVFHLLFFDRWFYGLLGIFLVLGMVTLFYIQS